MNKKGITVMEFVVAIGIMVLFIGGFSSYLMKNVKLLKEIYVSQKALFTAENKIEELFNSPSDSLKEGKYKFSNILGEGIKSEEEVMISQFKNGIKKIEVIIRWKTGKGIQREIKLLTLKK